jgi:hypothetical protein
MKKILRIIGISISALGLLSVVSYFLYNYLVADDSVESEPKGCSQDLDCVAFGEDGDCNCGCFNSDYNWDQEGDCFCAAPTGCKCVDGECQEIF